MNNNSQPLFLALLLTIVSCSKYEKEEIVIQPGASIRHDDFEYIVTDYDVRQSIITNEGTTQANGAFYIITLKVVNNAKRVDHSWDNSVAFIKDEAGSVYENQTSLQKKLEVAEPFGFQNKYITGFQSSSHTRLVFEIPSTVKEPYLMMRGQTLVGDFLDGNQFERTKVKLF